MLYDDFAVRILENKQIVEGFYDMWLFCPEIAHKTNPGQFITVKCDNHVLRRPISICEARDGAIRIVYEVRGEGTKWMSTQKAGDMLDILGPLGKGYRNLDQDEKQILLVGGGIGIPPLLYTARKCTGSSTAVLGFRSEAASFLVDDFCNACQGVLVSTDDGTLGYHGQVTDLVKSQLERHSYSLICACGPMPMLRVLAELAGAYGVECQVSLEERMACGVGACLGCVTPIREDGKTANRQVCSCGPVFNAEEVIW